MKAFMAAAGNLREFEGKLEVVDFAADAFKKLSPKLDKFLVLADNLLDGVSAAQSANEIDLSKPKNKGVYEDFKKDQIIYDGTQKIKVNDPKKGTGTCCQTKPATDTVPSAKKNKKSN